MRSEGCRKGISGTRLRNANADDGTSCQGPNENGNASASRKRGKQKCHLQDPERNALEKLVLPILRQPENKQRHLSMPYRIFLHIYLFQNANAETQCNAGKDRGDTRKCEETISTIQCEKLTS